MTESLEFESSPETSGPQMVPHSREAEEAVIGAVLINPEAYYDVAPVSYTHLRAHET